MRIILLLFCATLLMSCANHKEVVTMHSPYKDISTLQVDDILHLPTGELIDRQKLINNLASSRVIYVGETHDNINAHAMQLAILKAMHEQNPGKIGVGLEMLKSSSQQAADDWVAGRLSERQWFSIWAKNWSNSYALYGPILTYIQENNIPLIALRASDEQMMQVRKSFDNEAGQFQQQSGLPEMDFGDPYHRAHTEAIFAGHPHGKNSELFYAIQVLWDESMAESAATFLKSEQGEGKQLLVFAGSQHVQYGYGIPKRLFRRLPEPYTIITPHTLVTSKDHVPRTMDVTIPEIPLPLADYLYVVEHRELKKQGVNMGVRIDTTSDGVKIFGIVEGSAASRAGLQKEDYLLEIDDQSIGNVSDITYFLMRLHEGDKVVLQIRRKEEIRNIEVQF